MHDAQRAAAAMRRLSMFVLSLFVTSDLVLAKQDEPRSGQTAFFNEGKILVLGVDARVARISARGEFLALPIVLLNRSEPLTVARESLTLVRPDGVRLPVASPEEVWDDHGTPKSEARAARPFLENVFGRYPQPPFHWARLDFFPDKFSGIVPRDGMTLRLGDGAFGLLYFRHPDPSPPEGTYQLLFRPAGSDDTYVVDFQPYANKQGKKK